MNNYTEKMRARTDNMAVKMGNGEATNIFESISTHLFGLDDSLNLGH